VRTDGVVEAAEAVEALLLSSQVGGRWHGGSLAQGTVHAFVPAVLIGLAGLDELGADAELDPADGELREAADGSGCERRPVVGPDPVGQAERSEQVLEAGGGGFEIEAGQGAAVQEIAGVSILDGERVAVTAVPGLELTLEVGGPDVIGVVSWR
jgi:hypothetical protein